MKKTIKTKRIKPSPIIKEPTKIFFMEKGKFLHGTRGKPGHGPRGNRKY